MQEIKLDNDISVCCITAKSFPEGVLAAHQQLHRIFPPAKGRRYFGLSRPENGSIIYKAAAEELEPAESATNQLETLVIKKGKYISLTVREFMKDIRGIEQSFKQLLTYPALDPQGYCVGWHVNDDDVICMIRLKE